MNSKTSPIENTAVKSTGAAAEADPNNDVHKSKNAPSTKETNNNDASNNNEANLQKDNTDDNANKKCDDGATAASATLNHQAESLNSGSNYNNVKTFPLNRYMPRFVTPAERLAQRSAFVVEGVIENLRIVHACLADDLLARHEREEWVLRKKRRAQEKKSRRALEAARKALFRRNKNTTNNSSKINTEGGEDGAEKIADDQRSNKSKNIGSVSQTSKSTQKKKNDNANNDNNNDGDVNTNNDTCGYNTNKPEKNKSLPLVVINNSGPLLRSTSGGGVVLASANNMITANGRPKNKHQDIQIQVPRFSSSSAKALLQMSSAAMQNNNNNNNNNQNTGIASNATVLSVYGTTTNRTEQRTSPSASQPQSSQQQRAVLQHGSAAEASTSMNPNNNNIDNEVVGRLIDTTVASAGRLANPDDASISVNPPLLCITERKEISSSAFDALSKLFSEISYHHNIDTQEKEELKSMIGLRNELKIFEEHQKELDRRSKKNHHDQHVNTNNGNDDAHSQQEPNPEQIVSRLFASSLLSNAKHHRLHPLHPPLSELVKSISHNPASHVKTVRELKELQEEHDATSKKVIHHYSSRLYEEDNPFAGRFRILKQLGAGTFGAVFLCGWDSGAAEYEVREVERAEKENDPEAILKQKEAFVSEKQDIAKKQELVDEFERNTTEVLAKQLQLKQRTLSLDRNQNSNTSLKDNELEQQQQAPIYITPPRRASLEGSSGGSARNLVEASRAKSVVIARRNENNNNNNNNNSMNSATESQQNNNNDDNRNRGKIMYPINSNDAVTGSCTLPPPPPPHAVQQQQQQESQSVRIVTIRANCKNDSSLHERVLVGEEEDDVSTSGSVAMVNQDNGDNGDDDDDDDDDSENDGENNKEGRQKKRCELKNDDGETSPLTQRSDGVAAEFQATLNSQPLHEKENISNVENEPEKNPTMLASSSAAAVNRLAAAFDRHQQQMQLMRARKTNLLRHCLNPSGGVSTLASTKPFIVVTGLPIDAPQQSNINNNNTNNNENNNNNTNNSQPGASATQSETTGSKKYCREDIFVCKVELLDVGLLREDEYLHKEARRVGFLNSRLVPRRIPKSIFSQEALNNFMRKNPSGYDKQLKEQQKAMELREKKLAGEGGVTADEDLALEQIDDENRFLGDKRRQGLAHVVGLEYANRMKREAHILQNLAHPNIISYIDCFQNDGKQFLFLEYVDGGDFEKEIAKKRDANQCWNEESSLFFFVQIVLAVEYLHRHNILHRDLKLANILISKNLFLKVSDFGTAEQFNFAFWDTNEAIAKVAAGTPLTAAPELFQGQAYSEKADMYSLGVILYCILDPSGYPHYATDVPTLRQSVLTKPYRPVTRQLTDPVRNILHALLRKDPERRPTALQLLQTRPMQAAFTQYRRRVEKFVNLQTKPPHPTVLSSFPVVSPTSPHRPMGSIPRVGSNILSSGGSIARTQLVGSGGNMSSTNKTPGQQPATPTKESAAVLPIAAASTAGLDIDSLWLQVLEDQFELLQEFARQERRRLKMLLKQKRQELKLKLKQQKLQFQEGADGAVVSAAASSVASSGISGDYGFQSKTNDKVIDDDDDEDDEDETHANDNDDDDDDPGSSRSESSVSTSSQHSRREVERHRIKVAQKRAERAVVVSNAASVRSAGGHRRRTVRSTTPGSRSPSTSSSKSSAGSQFSREGTIKSGLGGVVGVATTHDSNRKSAGVAATTTVQMMKEAARISKKEAKAE